tara:strand:- start:445 stop:795 length:351 start_codon:yes stop_codon:yes gene_type:complete
MEIPEDIWNTIMGYFHSSYKKPSHYEAIMYMPEFYYTRLHHKESHKYSDKWNKSLIVDSYYMRMILNSHFNSSYRNTNNYKMNRGVASGDTRKEFNDIFEKYKNNSLTNIMKNLKY